VMLYLKAHYLVKRLVLWIKTHWETFLAVATIIVVSIMTRRRTRSISSLLVGAQKAHSDEVEILKSSHKSEVESILSAQSRLQSALSSIESKYKSENKKLDAKKKKQVEALIKDNIDDPDAITEKIASLTGFKIEVE